MSFNVLEIQSWIKAHAVNEAIPHALLSQKTVKRMASLKDAGPDDISFFFSKHYQNDLMSTRASVIVTGTAFVKPLEVAGLPQWKSSVILACDDPYSAMALLSAHFSKIQSAHDHQVAPQKSFIHPSAVVDSSATVGKNVVIQAGSVVEANASIGDGVVIYPQCYVGPNCTIGEGTVLFPRVTLYERTSVGKKCRIHSGAVIGADGFGYAPLMDQGKPVNHLKIYHLGRVIIHDEVEIGANTSIDRGTMSDTVIHSKAKIDNQVQVGHNCEVGEGSVICGCAGMAGSSSLGKFVVMGAQSGTSNQVHVGDYAKMGAYTGAGKDIEPGEEVMGIPARPLSDFYKIVALQNKLLRERRSK